MVPMATVMSLSLALITGARAAMALPPQMAVPPETRNPVSRLTLSLLVKNNPSPMVTTMENMVNRIPVFPASMACSTFMPQPRPTTDIWRSIWVIRLLIAKNGWPIVNDKIKPSKRAKPGSRNGTRNKATMKSTSFWFLFSWILLIIFSYLFGAKFFQMYEFWK